MDVTCQAMAMAAQGHSRSAYTIGLYFAVARLHFLWVFGYRSDEMSMQSFFMVELTQAHDQFLL